MGIRTSGNRWIALVLVVLVSGAGGFGLGRLTAENPQRGAPSIYDASGPPAETGGFSLPKGVPEKTDPRQECQQRTRLARNELRRICEKYFPG